MILQTLGAKYTFGEVLRHLFANGRAQDSEDLRQALAGRYDGQAVLYHKGRAALAEAIRLATGGSGSVAVSGLTCISVVQAVEAAGCTPVYVDIREDDLHFGASELSGALQKHQGLKAVVVQNMLGIPADIVGIQQVAEQAGLALIEDLAHSAGAHYADGREVGTVGDMTILSFGRDKALDVDGGGALIVRTTQTIDKLPATRVPLSSQLRTRLFPPIAWVVCRLYPIGVGRYVMAVAIRLGLVVRSADGVVNTSQAMPHWQAKRVLAQLQQLQAIAAARYEKASAYLPELAQFAPRQVGQQGSAPLRVPLLLSNRSEVVSHLRAHGVQASDIWYDTPIGPQRFYETVDYPEAECPVAVRVAARLINLPTHERITLANIDHIARLVKGVAKP